MNERIKELVEEAGFYMTEKNGMALAQFAELIVRECGVALHPMLRDMISRGQAYDLIKEHFGIE